MPRAMKEVRPRILAIWRILPLVQNSRSEARLQRGAGWTLIKEFRDES